MASVMTNITLNINDSCSHEKKIHSIEEAVKNCVKNLNVHNEIMKKVIRSIDCLSPKDPTYKLELINTLKCITSLLGNIDDDIDSLRNI